MPPALWRLRPQPIEVDDRRLPLRLLLDLEELAYGKAERPRVHQSGKRLNRVVVGQNRVVVDLAAYCHAVLRLRELGLQLAEVLVRLKLRIGLGDREQAAERGAENALGLRGFRGCLCLLRPGAGLRHGLERLALVSRVALHGLDEVGDQVPAPLELDLDLRPRVVDSVPLLDEAVVEQNEEQPDEQNDPEKDEQPDHGLPTLWIESTNRKRDRVCFSRPGGTRRSCPRLRRGGGDRTTRRAPSR